MQTRDAKPGKRVPGAWRSAVLLCCIHMPVVLAAQHRAADDTTPGVGELREGFVHPPAQARLRCYWWWLNGHTDKPTITHDLEEMKAKGFGGALLVDADGSGQGGNRQVAPGPTFASAEWIDLYMHALKEADRLGLEITLNINSGWNLGGPGVIPEESSKLLTWSRTPITGGAHVTLQLQAPEAKNGFYRQIAVLAYPLHNAAAAAKPRGLPGLPQRSAAVETGFSMPQSGWMLSPKGTPASGTGLNQPTENDLKQVASTSPGTNAQGAERRDAPAGQADAGDSDVLEISARVSAEGTLTWDPPPGAWEVLRIGYTDSDARVSTSSGAWQGRALDHLSRAAFDSYWDRVVEPLLIAAKPYRSLKYLATDSWELGGTNWTEGFAAEFKARRGYDPLPWLPVVAGRIISSRDASARFLTDLRRTVADLIAVNHYDRFAERAAEHHLGVQAESGGPHGAPLDALETFRHSAIPQTEFWSENPHRSTDLQRFFPKQAASAANIYGKRFVAAEGETSINEQWSESLASDLKPSFDMAITEGMNRLVWHEFTSSPAATGLPGQEYFAGTHLNPKVTWWNAGEEFFRYLNRVQFLMQQGSAVNDVLYFYGDNVPSFVRLKADDPAHVLPGYDYDVTDEDALLHSIDMANGKLRGPGGVEWQLLALPTTGRLSMAVLERVESYVREGGTVVGMAPASFTGRMLPAERAGFEALVRKIWGTSCSASSPHAYGRGRVVCTADTHAALAFLGVLPDVAFAGEQALPAATSAAGFDYIHRRSGDLDIYFLRNGSGQESSHNLVFRAHGRPQLWDAVTGATHTFASSRALPDGRTQVGITLPPFGSTAILFVHPSQEPGSCAAASTRTIPVVTSGAWSVSFQAGRGAPPAPVEVKDLTSWTEWKAPGVRYFSGTATYRTRVTAPPVPAGSHVLLRLGDVHEIARVRLNGKDAGTIWAKPYALEVGALLHSGENLLELEVTNLWANRLIGDAQPGATERFTSTNITAYVANSPLLPSGIMGPLMWQIDAEPETQRSHPPRSQRNGQEAAH